MVVWLYILLFVEKAFLENSKLRIFLINQIKTAQSGDFRKKLKYFGTASRTWTGTSVMLKRFWVSHVYQFHHRGIWCRAELIITDFKKYFYKNFLGCVYNHKTDNYRQKNITNCRYNQFSHHNSLSVCQPDNCCSRHDVVNCNNVSCGGSNHL